MITRDGPDGRIDCIRQHDHAAISAALAEAWVLGGVPDDDVRFAVAHHDVAWVGLDRRARFAEGGRLHSFLDHPLDAKYDAHRTGVDLVETGSAYAALLCSRHYARFASMLDDERSQAYLAHEQQRQRRLWPQLSTQQQARADHDLALLQLLDALSLFACCNRPGETTWPWYRDGFRFAAVTLRARWLDTTTIRLDPDPLAGPVHTGYVAYRSGADGVLADPVHHAVCFTG